MEAPSATDAASMNAIGADVRPWGMAPDPLDMRRRELFALAAPVFRASGYRGATIKALAHACHLSPAGLYHYFGSKSDLATYSANLRYLASHGFEATGVDYSPVALRVARQGRSIRLVEGDLTAPPGPSVTLSGAGRTVVYIADRRPAALHGPESSAQLAIDCLPRRHTGHRALKSRILLVDSNRVNRAPLSTGS